MHVSRPALLNLVGSLRSLVEGLKLPALSTPWSEYYNATNYSREAFDAKRACVAGHLAELAPATVLDLGANVGTFSRVAAERARYVISAEMDPLAVERNYLSLRNDGVDRILPLVVKSYLPPMKFYFLKENGQWKFLRRVAVAARQVEAAPAK